MAMNIKQVVLEHFDRLTPQKQEAVLQFIQSLLINDSPEPQLSQQQPSQQQSSQRHQFIEKILQNLQRIQRLHDGLPSAVYVHPIFSSIQEMSIQLPTDSLLPVLKTLYDAMAWQNHWIQYTPQQYQAAHCILQELSDRPNLEPSAIAEAIQALEQIGFNQQSSEITAVSDTDLDDAD